jgi:hypothetical protein
MANCLKLVKSKRGRGYGGTVLLTKTNGEIVADSIHSSSGSNETVQAGEESDPYRVTPELELYDPALRQLNDHWCRRRQLDDCHCEIIALQGRRETGGSWSRPDIAMVGYRRYDFLPEKVFELHTFELKAASDVSIKGVLEALAHREAATRSYVLYHTAGRDLDDFPESGRIEELAGRYGIGVIAAKRIEDINDWEERVIAQRGDPDPESVDKFIKISLSEKAKSRIRRWF